MNSNKPVWQSLPDHKTTIDPTGAIYSLLMLQHSFQLVKEGKACVKQLVEGYAPLVSALEALGLEIDLVKPTQLIKLWQDQFAHNVDIERFLCIAKQVINETNAEMRRRSIQN
jgi:hypothetical protein